MTANMNVGSLLPLPFPSNHPLNNPLGKLAYQTLQQGKSAFSLAHKTLATRILSTIAPPPPSAEKTQPLSPALLNKLQQRRAELLDEDWRDVERGVYPAETVFDHPWDELIAAYPLLCWDNVQIWARANQQQYQEFSAEVRSHLDQSDYPQYYLRNFHHQTDGYLSDQSADLYDFQVELLFNGGADAMRRRVIAPIVERVRSQRSQVAPSQIRILDVACGTGRTLQFLRSALPDVSLLGVDLSPAYLRKANQRLGKMPAALPQLAQANAEALPYQDNTFAIVTSTFLFHELPGPIRQRVIEECYRVLQPGGLLVLCDSMQAADDPDFAPMLSNFPAMFHEPFYAHYLTDDLGDRLHQAGFGTVETHLHFVSKYWITEKPTTGETAPLF